MSEKAARGLPGDTLGPPRVHFEEKVREMELMCQPRGRGCEPHFAQFCTLVRKKIILSDLLGYQFATPFLQENNRKKGEKGSTQDGGNVVIPYVESQKLLFGQVAEKIDFGAHFT